MIYHTAVHYANFANQVSVVVVRVTWWMAGVDRRGEGVPVLMSSPRRLRAAHRTVLFAAPFLRSPF